MSTPTFALSIRQPWAWLILHAGKIIENRTWATKVRGSVLIHAAKGLTAREYHEANEFLRERGLMLELANLPCWGLLKRGGIVGVVEIVDCVSSSSSPWFTGPYGFVLRNAKPLPFIPCLGTLGFFRPKIGGVV